MKRVFRLGDWGVGGLAVTGAVSEADDEDDSRPFEFENCVGVVDVELISKVFNEWGIEFTGESEDLSREPWREGLGVVENSLHLLSLSRIKIFWRDSTSPILNIKSKHQIKIISSSNLS